MKGLTIALITLIGIGTYYILKGTWTLLKIFLFNDLITGQNMNQSKHHSGIMGPLLY